MTFPGDRRRLTWVYPSSPDGHRGDGKYFGLTLAQLVIVRRLLKGEKPRHIAVDLGMTGQSVNNRIAAIKRKVGVKDRHEFAAWLAEHRAELEEA